MMKVVDDWLKSIGFNGEARGSCAGIYPSDVGRLKLALLNEGEQLAEMAYAKGKEEGRASAPARSQIADLKAEMRATRRCINILEAGTGAVPSISRLELLAYYEESYNILEAQLKAEYNK